MSDNPGGMAASDGAGGQEADVEAHERGLLAAAEALKKEAFGPFPLMTLSDDAQEKLGRWTRTTIDAYLNAAGSQTKPDRAESLDQTESPGGSP